MDSQKLWNFRFATINIVALHDQAGNLPRNSIQILDELLVAMAADERIDCINWLRDTVVNALTHGSIVVARSYQILYQNFGPIVR